MPAATCSCSWRWDAPCWFPLRPVRCRRRVSAHAASHFLRHPGGGCCGHGRWRRSWRRPVSGASSASTAAATSISNSASCCSRGGVVGSVIGGQYGQDPAPRTAILDLFRGSRLRDDSSASSARLTARSKASRRSSSRGAGPRACRAALRASASWVAWPAVQDAVPPLQALHQRHSAVDDRAFVGLLGALLGAAAASSWYRP